MAANTGSDRTTDTLTPAMRQYAEQKAQCGDAILLFRMGDFYEMFHEDAKTASRALGLALTSRGKGSGGAPIPLAGIPFHALDGYLAKLLAAGFRVAVSEQVEDPKLAKGVVRREIVRIVTPGTLTDETLLDDKSSNYLVAARQSAGGRVDLAALELSTGAFWCESMGRAGAVDELVRLHPAELLLPERGIEEGDDPLVRELGAILSVAVTRRSGHWFDAYHAHRSLCDHFRVRTLAGFGLEDDDPAIGPAGAVIEYLRETQKTQMGHVGALTQRASGDFLQVDQTTWRSLEIERTLRGGDRRGGLLAAVDRTGTAMGGRLLHEWLCHPLADIDAIVRRQDAIAELRGNRRGLEELRERIGNVADIERITARLAVGRGSPRDLLALGRSLSDLPAIREKLADAHAAALMDLREGLGGFDDLARYISTAIHPDAAPHLREGGVIADGFNEELDRLRSVGKDGQTWLANFQAREAERAGISTLKVGFNRVFGYYIEVTNAQRDRVPPDYVRKQTLKNAERYITTELKDYETDVLTAQDRAIQLEAELFEQVRGQVAAHTQRLLGAGRAMAAIDVLAGLAQLTIERDYCRPEIVPENVLEIVDGRHPVLEQTLSEQFVPNDVTLDAGKQRVAIITGPNMAGKSTYIRQVALLTLLAHTGSFIPARSARIGLTDRLFARVGASDEISRGQSTFMVEMTEAANILNNATDRSVIILDEIGRGTSTYDGLSLAWAITEHVATRTGARTLFATHYHELTELANLFDTVVNHNVAVREWHGGKGGEAEIVFLHKIVPGGADKSYGIHVARLAGIPPDVVERSKVILRELEDSFARETHTPQLAARQSPSDGQLLLFGDPPEHEIVRELRDLDVNELAPLAALQLLAELQRRARK